MKVVINESAILRGLEIPIIIHREHRDMTKLASEYVEDFQTVTARLVCWINENPQQASQTLFTKYRQTM